MLDRPTIGSFYQTHDTAMASGRQGRILPDHYPLVTREGTVPVAALATRGLYSQARYRSFDSFADERESDLAMVDYHPDADFASREVDNARVLGSGEPDAQDAGPAADPGEPLDLAAGPAELEPVGKARLIGRAGELGDAVTRR